MKKIIWLTITIFTTIVDIQCYAQGIKGLIKDSNNEAIPNATIIVEKMSTGTVANSNGEYELSLPSGKFTILFEALGYQSISKEVEVSEDFVILDIILLDRVFQLNEVVINNGEDPAYDIMRKAIALAPYHLNQIKSYTSNVYLRGSVEIKTIPWILRNQLKTNGEIPIKEGDIFAEESVNEIKFEAPDKYHQRVISINSNIPESASAPIPSMQESFYSANTNGMVSPLSPQAFKHYRFVYQGFSRSNNTNICKIKVIPRQASTELYSGEIYIVEDAWTIYSVNLSNENTFGKIEFKQMFTPLIEDAWMPVSYSINASGSILGISGSFSYNGSVNYNNVEINKALLRPAILKPLISNDTTSLAISQKAKSTKNQKFLEEVAKKDKLNNRDMIKLAKIMKEEAKSDTAKNQSLEIKDNTTFLIEKDAKLKDSTYWNSNRPIPLTITEKKALQVDSTQLKKEKIQKDSTDKKPNKLGKVLGDIAFGTSHKICKDSSITLGYGGLIGFKQLQYNTVDGFAFRQLGYLEWRADSTHKLTLKREFGYAFALNAGMGEFASSYTYAPLRRGFIEFKSGCQSSDYNQNNGIKPFVNSAYTLFARENYEKLFEFHYLSLKNKIDLVNGLVLNLKLSYNKNRELDNNSDFSFFYKNSREFTSNKPDNANYNDEKSCNTAIAEIELEFTPFQHYKIEKGTKLAIYSKFPTFNLHYKKGIDNIALSSSDFDFLEGGINQWINMPASRSIFYTISGGGYLNKNNLPFTEFKHFNTQPLEFNVVNFNNSFTLLDFYKYSSSDYFVEGHFQYTSPYLLIKRLPFLSKQIWSESLYAKYLTNELIKNYCETGYSINHLFLVANAGVFAGFENGKFREVGFRLGVGF